MNTDRYNASLEKWRVIIQKVSECQDEDTLRSIQDKAQEPCGFCYEFGYCGNCPLYPITCGHFESLFYDFCYAESKETALKHAQEMLLRIQGYQV